MVALKIVSLFPRGEFGPVMPVSVILQYAIAWRG